MSNKVRLGSLIKVTGKITGMKQVQLEEAGALHCCALIIPSGQSLNGYPQIVG